MIISNQLLLRDTAGSFLFDECLSHLVVERQIRDWAQLYGGEVEVAHLFGKFSTGTPDREWLGALNNEGGWTVISADRGTHSKKDERLPLICRELGVTHVTISAALHRRSMAFKALAIETCWPALIDAASYPAGTGFSLSLHGAHFRFAKLTDARSAQSPAPHQTTLFDIRQSENKPATPS